MLKHKWQAYEILLINGNFIEREIENVYTWHTFNIRNILKDIASKLYRKYRIVQDNTIVGFHAVDELTGNVIEMR
jgi:hypothetical protein